MNKRSHDAKQLKTWERWHELCEKALPSEKGVAKSPSCGREWLDLKTHIEQYGSTISADLPWTRTFANLLDLKARVLHQKAARAQRRCERVLGLLLALIGFVGSSLLPRMLQAASGSLTDASLVAAGFHWVGVLGLAITIGLLPRSLVIDGFGVCQKSTRQDILSLRNSADLVRSWHSYFEGV